MEARSSIPPTHAGLSSEEAAKRLREEGPNELQGDTDQGLLHALKEVLREPMLSLLLAAGGLYLLLGEPGEAVILLSFVVVIIGITLYQNRRTERALSALRELSSPRALVLRDGKPTRIVGREVVRGDVVVLTEGDRVPADGSLLECASLQCDESLLTGESVPVRKLPKDKATDVSAAPGGEDRPFVYSGTLVVRGRGVVEVTATGPRSELGRIGASLAQLETERSPLQQEVARMVRTIALAGVGLCLLLALFYGLTRGEWLRGFLAAIALAMAVLPEELPVVLEVFFALGAWRLSKVRVLTRRPAAIEALGAATILCTDKTGTLTENRMRVQQLWTAEGDWTAGNTTLPECVHRLLEYGILASQPDPFDPMDRALRSLGQQALEMNDHLHAQWPLLREYPLTPELLSVAQAWGTDRSGRSVIATKGSPETIIDLCHLTKEQSAPLRAQVERMASQGLRVLGVASADFSGTPLEGQHDYPFVFEGLVGLQDPLRSTVANAVKEARTAGLRVLMITGDHPETARSIANDAGLDTQHEVLTGPMLEQLSEQQLRERLRTTSVIARAVPEHKLRIVRALQEDGAVVAMTGDGVNDAPALKAAHIGIAMGARGTDVAREAASLVLTDDAFDTIVAAVRQGRRLFDNLRKAVAYVVAVHVPIIGAALVPVLLGWPLLLFPVQIVVLELLIDPACSLAFEAEAEEPDVMTRPPRKTSAGLFDRSVLGFGVLQGTSVMLATLATFRTALNAGLSEGSARALAFATLLAGNIVLIHTNRAWRGSGGSNRIAWIVSILALGAMLLSLFVPPVQKIFRFEMVQPSHALLAALLGAVSLVWFSLLKRVRPSWLAA